MDQMIGLRQRFCLMLALGALLTLRPPIALSQEPRRGELLVATPALDGTAFAQTVILLVHHDEDGSIGIMINRPTNLEPETLVQDSVLSEYQGPLYFGGPVAPTRPLMLYRGRDSLGSGGAVRILNDVYLHADASDLQSAPPSALDPARVRLYAGRAEWRAGQLNQELSADLWEIVDGNSELVFSARPFELWRTLRESTRQDTVSLLRESQRHASAGIRYR